MADDMSAGHVIGESRWRAADRQIVQLQADNAQMRETLEEIGVLHHAVGVTRPIPRNPSSADTEYRCNHCGDLYPCATVALINRLHRVRPVAGGI